MTTPRTALPLPTMDDVLRDLNAGDPEMVVLITRSMVRPGPPDGIPLDDRAFLAHVGRRRSRREAAGFVLFWALAIAACLIFWSALVDELLIHLGR